MMKYEEFKSAFIKNFQAFLPAHYADWEMKVTETMKVNGYRDTLCMMPVTGAGGTPNLYLDELYDDYLNCENLTKTCQKAAAIFVLGMDYITRVEERCAEDFSKDRIIFVLIPQEGNERLLTQVPHRITLDLALIYRVIIDSEDGGFDSTIITKDIAEDMNLTEEDLYELAMENTPALMTGEIQGTHDVFSIVTNERHIFGATAMLYPGLLASIADDVDNDLFILPASMHEVFVVPDMGQNVAELNRVIAEANACIGERDAVLSNHAYYYQRDIDKVCIPNTSV